MFKNYFRTLVICTLITGITFTKGFTQTDSTKSQDTDLSLQMLLKTKVTTASKTSQELENAPAIVIVITQEQIRSRGYQSLLDVMYDLPDVKVDDKVNSLKRNNFVMRGTQGQDKFIILLDGNPISSPIDEALPIMENYPVNLAEQIEIVYGPASALYGANAVSGVINIISKKSFKRQQTAVNVSSMIGSNGLTNTTLFLEQKLSEHFNLVISGQYYYDQQPDVSKTFKEDSMASISSYSTGTLNTIFGAITPEKPIVAEYQAPLAAYNIYIALHADDFSIAGFRNSTTTPSSYGTNTLNALYNNDAFIRQNTDMINATYKKTFGQLTTTTSLTASDYTLDPQSNYRNLYTEFAPAYKYETASTVKSEEQLDFKPSEKVNFTLGASYTSYSVVPYSADLDDAVNPNQYLHASYLGTDSYYRPDGLPVQFYFLKYHNTGTYFQTQYLPQKKINFTFGLRYDDNSRYGATINPRAGVVYKPFNKTTVKAFYGSAYIAPTPSESYGTEGSFITVDSGKTYHSYFLHLPNPGLKPVTSKNWELNIQQFISENLSLTVDGYYTTLYNMHTVADDNKSTHLYNNVYNGIPVDYIEVSVNQDRQQNYGGSLSLNLKHSIGRMHLNSYASFSYVDGKVDHASLEEIEAGPSVEPEFLSHLIFKAGTDIRYGKFTCSPRLSLIGKQNITGISDSAEVLLSRQKIDGYALLNLSLRYTISKKFSVFTNVTNALNQHYRSVGFNMDLNNKNTELFYGQPEDPIRIMGGVNFNF